MQLIPLAWRTPIFDALSRDSLKPILKEQVVGGCIFTLTEIDLVGDWQRKKKKCSEMVVEEMTIYTSSSHFQRNGCPESPRIFVLALGHS
jgi:hypothetical protein